MGLFRRSKTEEKTDPFKDDPVQAEINRYREEQRRKLGSDMDRGSHPGTSRTDLNQDRNTSIPMAPRSPSPTLDDTSILPTTMANEYACSQCNLKFKESWNRCPKCGGDVNPVGLDQPEDMKKLYPDTTPDGVILPHPPHTTLNRDHPGSPAQGGPGQVSSDPRSPIPHTTQQVQTAKKIRKVRRPGTASGSGKPTQGPSRSQSGSVGQHPRSQPSIPGMAVPSGDPKRGVGASVPDDINALFDADPELDDPRIRVKRPPKGKRSAPKGFWKDVPTIAETTSHSHSPPPEVRSMLSSLMDTGDIDQKDPARGGRQTAEGKGKGTMDDGSCSKCGFSNPPGSWEFCMKCGNRF